MLARYDIILVRRTSPAIGTEACEIEGAQGCVFDVAKAAVGTQAAEASGIMRAWRNTEGRCGRDVKISALW